MSEVLLVACLNRHFVLLFQKLCVSSKFFLERFLRMCNTILSITCRFALVKWCVCSTLDTDLLKRQRVLMGHTSYLTKFLSSYRMQCWYGSRYVGILRSLQLSQDCMHLYITDFSKQDLVTPRQQQTMHIAWQGRLFRRPAQPTHKTMVHIMKNIFEQEKMHHKMVPVASFTCTKSRSQTYPGHRPLNS